MVMRSKCLEMMINTNGTNHEEVPCDANVVVPSVVTSKVKTL
jgi:hypothetical protein